MDSITERTVPYGKDVQLDWFYCGTNSCFIVGTPLEYSRKLHSEEYGRNFAAERIWVQIVTESEDKNKLSLSINRINVSDWFKEQFNKLNQSVHTKQEQKRSRSIRY